MPQEINSYFYLDFINFNDYNIVKKERGMKPICQKCPRLVAERDEKLE